MLNHPLMSSHSRRLTAGLVLALMTAAGCQNRPPQNRGTSGYRLDPSHDAQSELGSKDLRSQDLLTATEKMAMDLATRLDIANAQNPPRIFVARIENRSSMRAANYQIFLTRLRANLNRSSARQGFQFVRERQYVEDQRDREFGSSDPANSAANFASSADYALSAVVEDLPSGGTNFYQISYQLVQLRDQPGDGRVGRAGDIIWENLYDVKYQ